MTQNAHQTPQEKAEQLLKLLDLDTLEPQQQQEAYALIRSGADLTVIAARIGEPALIYTIKTGHVDVAQTMIQHGCDVNIRDKNGHTALFATLICGQVETAQALLDAGADVDAKDNNGRAPADYARQFMGSETAKLLIKVSDEKRALKTYIENGAPVPNSLRIRKMLSPTQKRKP